MGAIVASLFVIPWLATLSGSLLALKMKLGTARARSWFLGFAAGVMIASSIWSLLLPAFAESGGNLRGVGIVSLGFLLGCLGMLLLDKLMPHQHMDDSAPEGRPSHMSRPMLLVMAVALHNIPEGMALGVVIASVLTSGSITLGGALAFGLGLALQNFPEGMAVVVPMRQAGVSQRRCAFWGILASFAEPAAALLGLAAASLLTRLGPVLMPVMLGMAAGAMIFIVVEELIPESQDAGGGHAPTYGFLIGFWLMAAMGVLGG